MRRWLWLVGFAVIGVVVVRGGRVAANRPLRNVRSAYVPAGAVSTLGRCHWERGSSDKWVKANGINLDWRACLQVPGATGSCVAKTPYAYVKCAQLQCFFDEASCRMNSLSLQHGDRMSVDCQTSQP